MYWIFTRSITIRTLACVANSKIEQIFTGKQIILRFELERRRESIVTKRGIIFFIPVNFVKYS